eukprot:364380-Chlamydomonas_euryale.AAC.13
MAPSAQADRSCDLGADVHKHQPQQMSASGRQLTKSIDRFFIDCCTRATSRSGSRRGFLNGVSRVVACRVCRGVSHFVPYAQGRWQLMPRSKLAHPAGAGPCSTIAGHFLLNVFLVLELRTHKPHMPSAFMLDARIADSSGVPSLGGDPGGPTASQTSLLS